MQRRAIKILTGVLSANHWYAEDKFYRGINSYDTGLVDQSTALENAMWIVSMDVKTL